MIIKTLNGINSEEILEVFNSSFSDYFIPFRLSLEQLNSKLKSDKIHLDISVGAFNNKKLVAFILHGFDVIDNKRIIYNGGTGVIPEERGKALTKRMYSYVLPILNEQKIDEVCLEVISENIQAIKSYKSAGFIIERDLACYKGEVKASYNLSNLELKEIDNYNWKLMQSFWNFSPTWQNSKNVIKELKDNNKSIGAYIDNQLVGYIICNVPNRRIQQMAVHKDYQRRKIGSSLISFIIKKFGNDLSIINIDKSSKPMNAFLLSVGFENYIDQIEMKLYLAN